MRYDIYKGVKRIKTRFDLSKSFMGLVALALPAVLFISTGGAQAAASTVVVTPANNQGWVFNPDPANATPYNFTEDEASIGQGSLFVQPIGASPAQKFIATKTLNTPVANVNSIAYDFMIAGNGTIASANQFYLNVYTNLHGSTTFYDCRFDYVPLTGSTTDFTTATFNATDVPTNVRDRDLTDIFTCPTTLAGMPAGSTVSFIAINVGDTTISDVGLAGYLDKVVLSLGNNVTTYDFELRNVPHDKNQCKNHGWMSLTDANGEPFRDQKHCVSFVAHNQHGHPNGHHQVESQIE